MTRFILVLALIFAAGMAANGVAMIVDPLRWYLQAPGVARTGPFNQHFIRDIGMIYALVGAAFAVGCAAPARRALLWGSGAIWLASHALFHIVEVATGLCGPSALATDFAGVTVPALLAVGLTVWAWLARGAPPRPN